MKEMEEKRGERGKEERGERGKEEMIYILDSSMKWFSRKWSGLILVSAQLGHFPRPEWAHSDDDEHIPASHFLHSSIRKTSFPNSHEGTHFCASRESRSENVTFSQ